ncbi:uncharacterized protein L969DRAFT_89810 [Mixia osmundae IAM 14324]|uniref:Uncharacterized protein n=1 Tax=Mixia osmundae (strain CBS 9802 / IAM 14324 / JCM 22182 / KY 12970) TaxID=764103 RepID=G7DUZ3_MIXOS|nr:uncharacterized protein L969DRAFT_89810 [Mixia osmundae IAM 14324]KEI37264.1 hypothetical protein L969DRAFT_89810 [Mixia osmundae IAM 14324]GAA94403.1 hypothetical protein E5Q_01055 [Mixia osmundae IAM 14324]
MGAWANGANLSSEDVHSSSADEELNSDAFDASVSVDSNESFKEPLWRLNSSVRRRSGLLKTFIVLFCLGVWAVSLAVSLLQSDRMTRRVSSFLTAAADGPTMTPNTQRNANVRPNLLSHWHKAQDWHPLVGSNSECAMYQERYRPYTTGHWVSPSPPPHKGVTIALLLRMSHTAFQEPMRADRLLSYRALIAEAEVDAGIDVYFVPHVPANISIESFMTTVRSEFRDRTIPFSFETASAPYPDVDWQNVLHSNHIAVDYFLDLTQAQQYDGVWWAEEDVRLLGSWKTFFENVKRSLAVSRWQSWVAEEETRKPPNLILFMGQESNLLPPWVEGRARGCLAFSPPEHILKAWITIGYLTRKLHETFKELYRSGINCYTEEFIPTAARHANLSTISISMPVYKRADRPETTFDWGGRAAPDFYRDWRDLDICVPTPMLLHKWKV